jgi:hypothetical protein
LWKITHRSPASEAAVDEIDELIDMLAEAEEARPNLRSLPRYKHQRNLGRRSILKS